jgi:hypothetical protein
LTGNGITISRAVTNAETTNHPEFDGLIIVNLLKANFPPFVRESPPQPPREGSNEPDSPLWAAGGAYRVFADTASYYFNGIAPRGGILAQ